MSRLKQNYKFLKTLSNFDNKIKKSIIGNATKEEIYSICEAIINILNKKISINDSNKDLIRKNKIKIKKLLNKSKLNEKKEILQTGGFIQLLEAILPPIITGLTSLILSKNE